MATTTITKEMVSVPASRTFKPTDVREVVSGKVIVRGWTKSGESYSAGGSSYPVLEGPNGCFILRVVEADATKLNEMLSQLNHLASSGEECSLQIELLEEQLPPPDPMQQHIVGMDTAQTWRVCGINPKA